jgi:hypothetical protein
MAKPFTGKSEQEMGGSSSHFIDYNLGYRAGYASGYQTGKADAMSNATSNTTQLLNEVLGMQKQATNGERSPTEIYLSLGLILAGLICVSIEALVVIKKRMEDRNSIRLVLLTIVIAFGVALLPVGYSELQIAPVMTMLGGIAGYLLAGIDLK